MRSNKTKWEEYIPERVTLCYVDYRDNLDNQTGLQQECLFKNNLGVLYENIWYLYRDLEADSMFEYVQEIEEKMMEDGLQEEFYENEDIIREAIYERDNSSVVRDLIGNTSNEIMFYSLGVETGDLCYAGSDYNRLLKEDVKAVKKALGIKGKEHDRAIEIMIAQASYGGELRIYFNERFDKFITNTGQDFQSIRFSGNVNIAIANSDNGSGDCTKLPIDITLPFKRENLFIDREVKYSFAHEVCGMSSDYAKDTIVELSMTPMKDTKLKTSKMAEHMEQEREYDGIFRIGKCSFGDMNIGRHRDVYYIDNFPCGNKCPHCGTFWID
jgi:hypothetical protein